ncbi:hypothetical protein [Vreelandella boliviensis]|uniref:Uncharacterized protein n=1 Tax=Vreelandella boliviensis LC1 TaxID=1072583 RepID=A0ABX4G636_9GAMM|nr:hypothetical protein [Halomonas boliviensis]OZT73058.1 hypothetical protein CE457_16120 [Halomonas boliviensis LC1]
MHAIEFEMDIQNGMVKIPDEYEHLKNRHARIVVLYENTSDEADASVKQVAIDFTSVKAPSLVAQEGVEYQRNLRDEW